MTAWVIGLLGALIGASAAGVSGDVRPWVVALVGGVMAFQAAVVGAVSVRNARTGVRLLVLVVGVKALQLVSGNTAGVDVEFVVAVAVGITTWVAAGGTVGDLDAIERGIDVADGLTPVQRIRIRATVLGTLVVTLAAWGVIGLGGLLDLHRPAAAQMSAAPFLYFVVALTAIGHVARRAELRRWERGGARIDADVMASWSRTVIVIVVGTAAIALAIPALVPGLTAMPATGVAASGRFGDWVTDRMLAFGDALDTDAVGGDRVDGSPVAAPDFEPVEPTAPWLGDVALWLLIGLVFASVIVRARNWRPHVTGDLGERFTIRDVMAVLWRAVFDAVAGVWRFLRGLILRRSPESLSEDERAVATGRGHGVWHPSDPIRRRIAAAYRAARRGILPVHGPLRRAETPRELAKRVEMNAFTVITDLFEEARYSDHVLGASQASAAEGVARELSQD